MVTYAWRTFHADFPTDGTTPLNQNTLSLYQIPVGSSIRRTLLHAQLSCQVESSMPAAAPTDFIPRVRMAVGLWLNDTPGAAANSPSVLDAADTEQWLIWDALQERCDVNDLANSGLSRFTWETPAAGLDVQTRRTAVPANSNDLWLGWQMIDPDGVVNTSGASYNAYFGGWYSVRFLISTP
jgi:hypothetical protein